MSVSMNIFTTLTFYLISLLLFFRIIPTVLCIGKSSHALTPPRGWNSYDSFCWTISEEEFLQNAELVSKRLHSHGYEYVVVDYLWYRRKVPGAYPDSSGFDVIDEWGRMIPDPDRWPSSKGGKGFTEVAKRVHSMGLKFGIHVMRGISFQAVNANTLILDTTKGGPYMEGGRKWSASDIGIKERACAWMSHGFMSVNTKTGAGKAFLRSLYEQYAQWGVDFVKHDCVFGDDFDIDEIAFVSEVLKKLDRPIMYSLSPGTSVSPAMAKQVSGLVNMYRITGDDWDTWRDVVAHFDITRDMAAEGMMGSTGLMGRSWPDLDMLPLGWLTDAGSNEGPHRQCNLNINEQKTQITLWAMAKSPFMFGGDMRKLDETTYNLITNPTILEINAYSSNNKEFPLISNPNTHKCNQNIQKPTRSHSTSLTLVSCMETKAKGWEIKSFDLDFDQICWTENSRGYDSPFCLCKKKTLLPLDVGSIHKPLYHRKAHLLTSTSLPLCIYASSKQRLTSKDIKSGSLSPCEWHDNQMWELGSNGTLMSSYSGLCASVQKEGNVVPSGLRSWIATGRRGEIYLAFFNLNQAKTKASTKWSDVAKALPYVKTGPTCRCKEVWSNKPCQMKGGLLSIDVEAHGVALLLLMCH